jgi:hypothetical protein
VGGSAPGATPSAARGLEPAAWHVDEVAHHHATWTDQDQQDQAGPGDSDLGDQQDQVEPGDSDRGDQDDRDDPERVGRDDAQWTQQEEADLTKLAEPPLHEPDMERPHPERTDPERPPSERPRLASALGGIGAEGGAEDTVQDSDQDTAAIVHEARVEDARGARGAPVGNGAHAAPRRRSALRASLFRQMALRSRVALFGLIVAVLALAAPLLISSATRGPVAARPTAVPPTPTVTPIPSPTLAVGAGLSAYIDSTTGYEMGYPASWTATQQNPGVAFDDADNNYEVHVILPDNSALPSQTDPTSMAANWVNYALDSEQQRWGASNFQRLGGPTPPVTIGGQAWQTGTALIGTPTNSRIRLQVYATIHNGEAFVLVLLAPDELFARGQQAYFGPMLASFEFLPASS